MAEYEIPKWQRATQAALVQFARDGATGRITLFVSRDAVLHIETERTTDLVNPSDDVLSNQELRFKLEAGDRKCRLGQVEVFEAKIRKTRKKASVEILERIEL